MSVCFQLIEAILFNPIHDNKNNKSIKCALTFKYKYKGNPSKHKLLAVDDETFLSMLPKLNAININEYALGQETFIDAMGINHIAKHMECKDEVFMDETQLTQRVLSVINAINDSPIDYQGWGCSNNAGSKSSGIDSNHDHSDIGF